MHTFDTVLSIGGPALAVAAVTLGRHKIVMAVELASGADMWLLVPLEFANLFIEDHLGLDERISFGMVHLDYLVYFLFMVGLGVVCNVLFFELFCTDLAFHFFVITVSLMFPDLYKFPHLETVTTFDGLIVYLLAKRGLFDWEFVSSAKWTPRFLFLLLGLPHNILMASLAEQFPALM